MFVFFQLFATEARFVGTDAHKLVKYGRTDMSNDKEAEFIMTKKPLNLLKSVLQGSEEDVTI